jgi:hypothetical protein
MALGGSYESQTRVTMVTPDMGYQFGTNEVFDSSESSGGTNKTPPLTASGNMCKKAAGRLIDYSIDDDMLMRRY